LLRADGDPIGDGTAEDLGHSIVVFRRIEVQPGVLGILLQQILTLKAATYTLTDQLNQVLKLTFIRGFDALESRGPLFFEQDPDHQNVIVVHAGSGQQRALIYSEYADVEFELDPP
jgi:hypothetical protein